jgi:hypothetical protein
VRTFDAATGELLAEREILPPWPMDAAGCSAWGKTMGIVGTPVIYTEYEDGIAFFYVKSYIEYVPPFPPLIELDVFLVQ